MLIERDALNFYNLFWLDKYFENNNGIIAGGCFKNIFMGEKVKDIDMFFRSEEDFTKAKMFFDKNDKFMYYYDNDNVVSYKDENGIALELIKKTYGSPHQLVNNFDFTVSKFAMWKEDVDDNVETKIIHSDMFFEHLHMKRIVIDDKILFPVSTFERMIKYTKYGFYPCRETKIKLLEKIREAETLGEISKTLYDGVD
jgi:hypothetical protein